MQSLLIVHGDFVAGMNVAQGKEHNVAKDGADVGVRFAGMVDVVRTVAAAAPVNAPHTVNITDAQLRAMGAALSFTIGNALTSVFGYLATPWKVSGSKAAFAVDL
jgi:hypothetical protein